MVFWFCVASAGLSLVFVPFLTIGTQGHSPGTSVTSLHKEEKEEKEQESVNSSVRKVDASIMSETKLES